MQLDLNLLVVFEALLEEGSVGGAADRLHLSSPAVSRSLGRLRRLTGDEILVRTGRSMVPTPYALAIRGEVAQLVRGARSVLAPSPELNLADLDRTFTLRCHEGLATAVTPVLLDRVREQAPGVRLRILAEDSVDTDDLRRGHVDLQLGQQSLSGPEFRSEILAHDRLVVAMRSGHPGEARLSLDEFVSFPHVVISRRGRLQAPIDDVLEAHGLHRRIIAAVGTSTMALHAASRSDVLVLTTAMVSRPLIEALGLAIRPLPAPLEIPAAPVASTWHRRCDNDPAHAWLRRQVLESARQLEASE
jgi:DNA-binding transcriptional LysR family regulator